MKTVTGSVNSAKPISLSKAATLLSGFVSSETQASPDVSAYLRRVSAAFTELRSFHREIRSANQKSELQELGRAKGIDDLVENGNLTGDESVHGRKQDKKKSKVNKEEDVVEGKVMVKLEDEERNKERKKKNKDENAIDKQLEEERKKNKKKKSKKEDVIDEKLEEERKSKKKKKSSKEIDA
ncbi:hypothetical protein Bca4012_001171 [Brassica carinata]|uniref:Uncharacterized protein n=1 Tax=Brassica oleracea var. oleracea TaxID=109376 RepID=A0A0D3B2I1_BRAOL|nr:PREDICTED: protein MNN4-like [Brassica oleracea var. oleracea]